MFLFCSKNFNEILESAVENEMSKGKEIVMEPLAKDLNEELVRSLIEICFRYRCYESVNWNRKVAFQCRIYITMHLVQYACHLLSRIQEPKYSRKHLLMSDRPKVEYAVDKHHSFCVLNLFSIFDIIFSCTISVFTSYSNF